MQRLIAVAAFFGLLVGSVVTFILLRHDTGGDGSYISDSAEVEDEPLYWVAPMDPNYRRDGPGKSPMGMDLIPVYDQQNGDNDAGPGTVTISPNVVNNLGVRTDTAELLTLHSKIVTVGYVRYDEDKLIHIHPRVSGWVEKLYITAAGDPVKKGEPIYALYSPELVNAQEELLLAMNQKNSRLVKASEDRLEALQISNQFIGELKRSKRVKQHVNFYAPQHGVVDNLSIREGYYVQPGTTMLSIGALDTVWVEAEIFEQQASLIELNDPVTMTLNYLPGKKWEGKVDYIYPTLDNKTRTVRLRLNFENPDQQLKPNMFTQVVVHTNSEEQVLAVPRESVIRTGSQDRVVLALGGGSYKSVEIQAGRSDQNHIEVLSGVSKGEKVVTSAQFLIDSESSKSSDFKRLDNSEKKTESVWVSAEITNTMPSHRMISASHEAISEWQMDAMTMDFKVNSKIDIDTLVPGTQLHMEISKLGDGSYEIIGTHIMSSPDTNKQPTSSNHNKNKDHSKTDHSKMDHSKMDHSKMDHS